MEQVQEGAKGIALILRLNSDRILYVATVLTALGAGAFFGTLLY